MRQQCSGMMLQFILDYPLGARRLQHHLQFLITNLSFEHESGRQAAVDTMKVRPSSCSLQSRLYFSPPGRWSLPSSTACRQLLFGRHYACVSTASVALEHIDLPQGIFLWRRILSNIASKHLITCMPA